MSKRKQFTVIEKLGALDQLHGGASRNAVCKNLGITESTLRGWIKTEDKLRATSLQHDDPAGNQRKRAKYAEDDKLETAVITWFKQKRAKGVPISGPVLQAQALQFDKKINGDQSTFVASNGWLSRFKDRHGITFVTESGEAKSADTEAAAGFPATLRRIIEEGGYVPEQVYNCDETALYYRMLPTKTLAQKSEKQRTTGYKVSKERITALMCCNQTGRHKIPPLVIGKSAKPRCFKHVNMGKLSCEYKNTQRAWMTSTIFSDWFQDSFVPKVLKHLRKCKLEEKAILLLDNCSAHPPDMLQSRCGKVKVVFLPPNTTSVIQPCDQGIISALKRNYRRMLVQSLLQKDSEDIVEAIRTVTLKDAIELLGSAWLHMSATSIHNIWMKALGPAFTSDTDAEPLSDSDEEDFLGFTREEIYGPGLTRAERDYLDPSVTDEDIAEWFTADNNEPTTEEKSNDQIIDDVMGNSSNTAVTDQESDDETDIDEPPISSKEIIACTDKLIEWLTQQQDDNVYVINHARNIAHYVRRRVRDTATQSKISDFFKKN